MCTVSVVDWKEEDGQGYCAYVGSMALVEGFYIRLGDAPEGGGVKFRFSVLNTYSIDMSFVGLCREHSALAKSCTCAEIFHCWRC